MKDFVNPTYKIDENPYQECKETSVTEAPERTYKSGNQSVTFSATQTGIESEDDAYIFGIGFYVLFFHNNSQSLLDGLHDSYCIPPIL